MGFLLDCSN